MEDRGWPRRTPVLAQDLSICRPGFKPTVAGRKAAPSRVLTLSGPAAPLSVLPAARTRPAPSALARAAPAAAREKFMRPSRRQPDELRPVSLERGVVKFAEGSCMVKFGDTQVLVTATLEERLPPWLKGQGRGWVTAEYGMLPRPTLERTRREAPARQQA